MLHWTDYKIRVHDLYCIILALVLRSILQRRAANNGLSLSMHALFKALGGIQEVTKLFSATGDAGSPGRPQMKTTSQRWTPPSRSFIASLPSILTAGLIRSI
jgi:hypothetical protein